MKLQKHKLSFVIS